MSHFPSSTKVDPNYVYVFTASPCNQILKSLYPIFSIVIFITLPLHLSTPQTSWGFFNLIFFFSWLFPSYKVAGMSDDHPTPCHQVHICLLSVLYFSCSVSIRLSSRFWSSSLPFPCLGSDIFLIFESHHHSKTYGIHSKIYRL